MSFRSRARARLRSEKGQTMSEYLLVISVIVIAIVAATLTPVTTAAQKGSDGFTKTFDNVSQNGVVGPQGSAPQR